MEILKNENNLTSYLDKLQDKKITIISAFASKTETLIDSLLANKNSVELIIGTINAFSSPDFIEHCNNIKSSALKFFVDFGYQSSTHWKLYLVAPNTVIIGSANLTSTGTSLCRDTCLVITSQDLYKAYKKEVTQLKKSIFITSSSDEKFSHLFELYKTNHKNMQRALGRGMQYADGREWLKDDTNQSIPVFIWDTRHTEETTKFARTLLHDDTPTTEQPEIRDFFCYEAEGKCPYSEGDIVLCTSNKGSHLDFYRFDRIIKNENIYYLYCFKQTRYHRPFPVKDRKQYIKPYLPQWFDRGITELNRDAISSFMSAN